MNMSVIHVSSWIKINMSTPADGVLGGIAHIAALGASMHFIILVRPVRVCVGI